MRRFAHSLFATALLSGCVAHKAPDASICQPLAANSQNVVCASYADGIEYPDVIRCDDSHATASLRPRSMSDGEPTEFMDLTLEDVLRTAMQSSQVMRDLGGRVLASPQALTSIYDPAISQSHPRLGEEAALSAFDAQFQQSVLWNKNDLPFNNANAGGGAFQVRTDQFSWNTGLSKTAATGGQFNLTTFTRHLNSDAPSNLFPHAWTNGIEATIRQPLLQGAGVGFNRIARPGSGPEVGLSPGVLLARINTDLSVADFERGVRDFTSQVEDAYWALYQAYQTLDANRIARDTARETWKSVKTRYDAGLQGGEADTEAQAREQLYLFEQQVLLSLDGDSSSGANQAGVYPAERRLRQLMGLPVNDGRLIRPLDEPTEAPVRFDWDCSLLDALARRTELRRQLWSIKQRELELIAAKNFLLPRLDLVTSARTEGLGDDLLSGSGASESSLLELFSFQNFDVSAGVQFSVPLGFRRELAAVRHSELNLCRARAVLREQERAVAHELGEAIADVDTTYRNLDISYNRMLAADQVVQARFAAFDAGKVAIDALLEAQRRLAQARVDYFRSRVGHVTAIKNVHLRKGTLLPYNGIGLNEQASSMAIDCYVRERRHEKSCLEDYRSTVPCNVSLGRFDTRIDVPCADDLLVQEGDSIEVLPEVLIDEAMLIPNGEFLQDTDVAPSPGFESTVERLPVVEPVVE